MPKTTVDVLGECLPMVKQLIQVLIGLGWV